MTPTSRAACGSNPGVGLCTQHTEAADEIKRLRAAVKSNMREIGRLVSEDNAEIKRLRALTALEPAAPSADERDIVERLRDPADDDFHRCRYEAADEIERMRAVIVAADREVKASHADADRLRALTALQSDSEVEQLRRIRALLIKALAIAVGCPEDDEALLETPVTTAMKFRALIGNVQ